VIETGSIARGVFVADALVKRAAVRLLRSDAVTPGKLAIVFTGEVGDVTEAFDAAREAAGIDELDSMLLNDAHQAIVPALDGTVARPEPDDALGLLELQTVASTLVAADRALKEADVTLTALHLARGIGGKGYLAVAGVQDAVEAALEAGEGAVDPARRAGRELIARPHADVAFVLERL
jgi:microcompartment protein CcmL/EutN